MRKVRSPELRALRRNNIDPKIAEHRGRIVKNTGDGLLAEFASVVDAIRCAAAWQAAMPAEGDIRWRIGIHQGDIVVEDGDIFGDGVNVAARLEALAEPGGICVSARVYEDIREKKQRRKSPQSTGLDLLLRCYQTERHWAVLGHTGRNGGAHNRQTNQAFLAFMVTNGYGPTISTPNTATADPRTQPRGARLLVKYQG